MATRLLIRRQTSLYRLKTFRPAAPFITECRLRSSTTTKASIECALLRRMFRRLATKSIYCARAARRKQPTRKHVLPHPSPCLGQQLKQAPAPKQIQIRGIKAVANIEPLPLRPTPNPPILNPSQPTPIKLHRPHRTGSATQNPGMISSNRNEQTHRNQQPQRRKRTALETKPGRHQRSNHNQQPDISHPPVQSIKLRHTKLTSLQTLLILLRGGRRRC